MSGDISLLTETFSQLFQRIQTGDSASLLALFCDGKVSVNVPRYGQIGNNIVFDRYLKQVRLWLSQRENVRWEYWSVVHSGNDLAASMVIYFDVVDEEFNFHKTLHIPIGIRCEMEGSLIRTARVYYSTLWVAGHIMTRPAMLNEDPTLVERMPPVEKLYFKSLWAGDGKTILDKVIEPDAYFMGTAYSYNQGPDLIKTFNHLFEGGKNTELRICTAFSDEEHLCIEYMNHRSGGDPNTPSAGMAIYGISKNGKIAYVRLAGDSLQDHCLWPTL